MKKEDVRQVDEATGQETRERRINEMVEKLSAVCRLSFCYVSSNKGELLRFTSLFLTTGLYYS